MTRHSGRLALSVLLAATALLGMVSLASGAGLTPRATSAGGSAGGWAVQTSGTGQALFAVACLSAQRCMAVGAGGTIVATTNGGKTWRSQSNPLAGTSTVLYRIACVANSTCYVIGRPNIILVTHNSGASWSVHRITLAGLGPELIDATCVGAQVASLRGRPALCRLGLLDLACPSASMCLVAGTRHVPARIGVLAPVVFLTADGGTTWTRQHIPTTIPCQGDCTPSNARVPYPLEWIDCGPGAQCRAGGATFLGSHPGWATLVIRTASPGAPWTSLKPITNAGFGPAPDSAVCPTALRCYGVWTTSPFQSGNEIWLSTDGGWIWQGMSSGSTRLRNAITCAAATTCYSVGNRGTITASSNGLPFLAQISHTSQDLYGVTCVALRMCVAVGNAGTIVARKNA